jgi:Tol biopolymer transport system component
MKTIYLIILLSVLLMFAVFAQSQEKTTDFPVLKGEYLGQKPPGMTPELFAPGIISTGNNESRITFSPDGNIAAWSVLHISHDYSAIIISRRENNVWTAPEVASFSGQYVDADPFFSYDGNRLFFTSSRPIENYQKEENYNLWMVERIEKGWGIPENLGFEINTEKYDVNPCLTKDGTLYFSSDREGGEGFHDIYYSRFVDGHFTQPVNIGTPVNTENFESSPYIAPDESYLIYNNFKNNRSESGLHISFRKKDGTWTKGINMGNIINDKVPSLFASVSQDGKYMFFLSNKVPYLPYQGPSLNYIRVMEMFTLQVSERPAQAPPVPGE